MKIEGWILQIGLNKDFITIWIKCRNGEVIPANFKYFPHFYAECKDELISVKQGENILNQHPNIREVNIASKYTKIRAKKRSKVYKITTSSPRTFHKVVNDVKDTGRFNLYNCDIPVTQKFFYDMELFPIAFCEFDVSMKTDKFNYRTKNRWPLVKEVILKDSNTDIFYKFPPLRVVQIRLGAYGLHGGNTKLKSRYRRPKINERLISCEIRLIEGYNRDNIEGSYPPWMITTQASERNEKKYTIIIVKEETEKETLRELSKTIGRLDPDIILSSHGDEYFFPYLVGRASANRMSQELILSRDGSSLRRNRFRMEGNTRFMSYGIMRHRSLDQFYLRGRMHVDTRTYGSLHFKDGNVFGVIEVGRVSRVGLQRLTRITIGGALQSIQFYIAKEKGYLIPPVKKNSEDFQTTMTLIQADRGGHIFEPKIGVFERVGEFDFTSMYPMIMVNYNVSPDTMNCECCKEDGNQVPGLPFYTCKKKQGIVSEALKIPLKKRIAYKRISKTAEPDVAYMFKKMNDALKWILVVSFGYLGFKNAKFGRVEGHQSVCAFSRELLLRAQEIAENRGFRVLHGIVDSIWLQHKSHEACIVPDWSQEGKPKLENVSHFTKDPAPEKLNGHLKEFNERAIKMAKEMKDAIKIPIGLDATYKFIVFLPSRENPKIPVLNHYWGVTYEGKIKVRGIEIRRRDAPEIVKKAQREIMDILASASNICDFMEKLPMAKAKLKEYYSYVDSGDVPSDELVIKNRVSRKVGEYKVKSYQALASEKMLANGIEIEAGQKVEYIIKNAESKDPNKRIILQSEFEKYNRTYDKEKYKELLKRAFENIIPFDCDKIDNLAQYSDDKSVQDDDRLTFAEPQTTLDSYI